MVHELGHCIGFRHTNWLSRGEPKDNDPASGDAVTIPGTPGEDPNSVMNGGTAFTTWNGFSHYDINAAIAMYTEGYWQNITPEGRLYQIDVGSGNEVWGLNAQNRIYKWNGSTWINITPTGALYNVSVGSDGTVWGLNVNYQPVQWNGNDWIVKPGQLKQISVGSANNIWGINSSNKIYKWNGSDWTNITPTGALKYVAAGNDGTVWGVNSSGLIYKGFFNLPF